MYSCFPDSFSLVSAYNPDFLIWKTANHCLSQSPTLSTIVPVTKGFFKRLGFRRKLLMFWMILSIAFVSLWPTITNAMTGYVPLNSAMVLIRGQNASVYADYTNITSTSNLAFQFAKTWSHGQPSLSNSSSPIFLKDGPNTTLWEEMYEGNDLQDYHTTTILTERNSCVEYQHHSDTYP